MKHNLLTIQLSVDALEKLIGDDPEFALSIRQAVITEFARRKLGKVLDGDAQNTVDREIKKMLFGNPDACAVWRKLPKLKPEIVDAINAQARAAALAAKQELDIHIKEKVETELKPLIDLRIEDRLKMGISEIVKEKVATALAAIKASINF